jgi:hypothetical protein
MVIFRGDMSVSKARVLILVKALPQPSKKYGETVCCAGVTLDRNWKRLFPVRFRQLSRESTFNRWNWVKFQYERPQSDARLESCHVFEDTISVDGEISTSERTALLEPMIVASGKHAAAAGQSLALVRPKEARFRWKQRSQAELQAARDAYKSAARQTSFLDQELEELEPTPFEFRFQFSDGSGQHDYQNGDWEAHAMFWREANRTSAEAALKWMDSIFNEEYPKRGMVFAIGNMARRPQTWQLLGVIRLDQKAQMELL